MEQPKTTLSRIDIQAARRLVSEKRIQRVSITAEAEGWAVWLAPVTGSAMSLTDGSDQIHLWQSLDQCVEFLTTELQLFHFDVDAGHRGEFEHDASDVATHDDWFTAQVSQAIIEADDPGAEWISHEDAQAGWARKRAEFLKRAAESDIE